MGFNSIGLTAGGYVAAAVLFWLWLGARDDVAQAVELCNQQKLVAVAEAENLAREASEAAFQRRLADIEAQLALEQEARLRASQGRLEADSRAEAAIARLNAMIRDIEETENAPIGQICTTTDVPADIRGVYAD